jgi:hypothetical protein
VANASIASCWKPTTARLKSQDACRVSSDCGCAGDGECVVIVFSHDVAGLEASVAKMRIHGCGLNDGCVAVVGGFRRTFRVLVPKNQAATGDLRGVPYLKPSIWLSGRAWCCVLSVSGGVL